MNKLILSVILSFISLILSFSISFSEKPKTIPALKEWEDKNGKFIFNNSSRILIDPDYTYQLSSTAQTFQNDIKDLKGFQINIGNGNQCDAGDILITLNSQDTTLGDEGYSLLITDHVIINASNETGAFYGTRSLLQMLKLNDTIQSGNARDWPDYKERGLMVDNARKYFSIDWLQNHIRELSYLKLNIFHLHITDNEGFRLECTKYPQITSTQFYKKSEIISLQKLADEYHVIIVPEIDMPNHMSAIVEHFPSTRLVDTNGNIAGNCCIDITLDESRSLVTDLLEEYLPLFTGHYWHTGCDEYFSDFGAYPQFKKYAQEHYGINAVPNDTFFGFINWIDSIVKANGKSLRIWNDCLNKSKGINHAVNINKDIIIEYWSGDIHPQELLDEGYYLMNCNSDRLYYLLGYGESPMNIFMFNVWRPNIFHGERTLPDKHPQILGSCMSVWCDIPNIETETQIAYVIRNTLRILSQLNWGSQQLDSNYKTFISKCKLIGLAPGVVFPKNPIPNDIAFDKKVFASSVEPNTDYLPENVVDGEYTTMWASTYKDSEWIYVDLEKSYNINRIKLVWEYSYAKSYEIQVSDDTSNWTTICSTDKGDGDVDEYTSLNAQGSYVRLFCIKRAGTTGNALYEIEVYGSTDSNTAVIVNNAIEEYGILKCSPNPFNSFIDI